MPGVSAEQLRRTVEQLEARAIAESHLQLAGVEENPWQGSCEQLETAKAELVELEQREAEQARKNAADDFARAFHEHQAYRDTPAYRFNASAKIEGDAMELATLSVHPAIRRYGTLVDPKQLAEPLAALRADPNATPVCPGAVDQYGKPFRLEELRAIALWLAKSEAHTKLRSAVQHLNFLEARYPVLQTLR